LTFEKFLDAISEFSDEDEACAPECPLQSMDDCYVGGQWGIVGFGACCAAKELKRIYGRYKEEVEGKQ
jgi:hypothetical protein